MWSLRRRILTSCHRAPALVRAVTSAADSKVTQEPPVLFDSANRPTAWLDESIKGSLLRGEKVGSRRIRCVLPPDRISEAMVKIFREVEDGVGRDLQQYLAAGMKLRRHLHGKHPPQEQSVFRARVNEVKKSLAPEYESKYGSEDMSAVQLEEIDKELEKRAEDKVRKRSYRWKPVAFDRDACFAYLLAKTPYDYATACRVMEEIRDRSEDFRPRTIFDFGSGVGSAVWAAQDVFGGSFTEIFSVDPSAEMNALARLLSAGGDPDRTLPAGIFYRMSLPSSNDLTYDLVTCTHTLLELPSSEARLTAVDKLWRKTGGFLILIEDGTNAGFQVLAEARDYLVQLSRLRLDTKSRTEEIQGHIFAPCPQEGACPRYFHDVVPCNFDVRYKTFQHFKKIPQEVRDLAAVDKFSYLVFRKGSEYPSDAAFPRLLDQPMVRTKKVHCRLCTNRGKLEEVLASKNGMHEEARMLHRYAKQLRCGDQMRVRLTDEKVPIWFEVKRRELEERRAQKQEDNGGLAEEGRKI